MASGSNGRSLTVETTTAKRHQLDSSTKTLTSAPQLPTLPFDLIEEILCRLPVKLLLQLQCLCKSLNSLISNPIFARKHLRMSTMPHHLMVSSINNSREFILYDSPIPLVFSSSIVAQTQLSYPSSFKNRYGFPSWVVCSCDGILCLPMSEDSTVLWNPSIRKFKLLPPLNNTRGGDPLYDVAYSFGYDHFIHNYKIVSTSFFEDNVEVRVNTMGKNFWRRIQDFPYSCYPCRAPGVFVSGTVNWLSYDNDKIYSRIIVSLDLKKESYQKFLHPSLRKHRCSLGVLKDCLCIFASSDTFFDVWVMKEIGNKESWTKLHHVPYMGDLGLSSCTKALYVYENDQMLMNFYEIESDKMKLGFYDSKNGTLKIPNDQNINRWMDPQVYVESLISPCS